MEALAQFEKAEKLNSSEFKIAEFIAKCHDKLGQFEASIRKYKEALAILPQNLQNKE